MEAFDPKQPYEAYYMDFDFVNDIVAPDEISTATITVTDPDGADVTSILVSSVKQNIESPKVYFWIQAGTSGKTYTITCKIVTDNGEKYEMEGTIVVAEI